MSDPSESRDEVFDPITEQAQVLAVEAAEFLNDQFDQDLDTRTPDEIARDEAYEAAEVETKSKLVVALSEAGLEFEFEEDTDAQEGKLSSRMRALHSLWDTETTKYAISKVQDDEKFDAINTEMTALARQLEIFYFLNMFTGAIAFNDEETLQEKVSLLGVTAQLSDQDKEAFINALGVVLGPDTFSALLVEIHNSDQIATQIQEESGLYKEVREGSTRRTQLALLLVDGFNFGEKVNHEDYPSFVEHIFTYDRLRRMGVPDEIIDLHKTQLIDYGLRLGVGNNELDRILEVITEL